MRRRPRWPSASEAATIVAVLARAFAFVLASVALGGCGAAVFECTEDDACPGGACQDNGYCSFPDPVCASGQRYGAHAPSAFAGDCVGDATTGASIASEASLTQGTTADSDESTGMMATTTAGSAEATTDPLTDPTTDPTIDPSMASITDTGSSGGPSDCEIVEFEGNDGGAWPPTFKGGGISIRNGVVTFDVGGAGSNAFLLYEGEVANHSFTFDIVRAPDPTSDVFFGIMLQTADFSGYTAGLTEGAMVISEGLIGMQMVLDQRDGFDDEAVQLRVDLLPGAVAFTVTPAAGLEPYVVEIATNDAPGLLAFGAYAFEDTGLDMGQPQLERIEICSLP